MVGNRTRVKVVKNKMAPPFRECEFDIIYGRGISRMGDMLDLAAENDIVKKAGAWYNYGKDRLGQGRDAAIEFLESNPKIAKEIEGKVRKQLEIPSAEAKGEKEEEDSGKKKK
jgi:recombination protein RecA